MKSVNHVDTESVESVVEVQAAQARVHRPPVAFPRQGRTHLGVVHVRRRRIDDHRRSQGMKHLCHLSVRRWRS